MPTTYIYGTGFEMGSVPLTSANNPGGSAAVTTTPKTGAYCLYVQSGPNSTFFPVPGTPSEVYLTFWINHTVDSYGGYASVYISTADGVVSLRFNGTSKCWDAYVDSALVASGTKVTPAVGIWNMIEIHVKIADAGNFDTKFDGVADITYAGDTKGATATAITLVNFYNGSGSGRPYYIDNLTMGTGGWCGDVRYEALLPTGDTATEDWTRSTGSDSYALVDERPPSGTDYLSSSTNGQKTVVSCADFDSSNKTPLFVNAWGYLQKDTGGGQQVKLLVSDGSNTTTGAAKDITTGWLYYSDLLTTAPDGSAWSDTDLDNVQIGVESVIP